MFVDEVAKRAVGEISEMMKRNHEAAVRNRLVMVHVSKSIYVVVKLLGPDGRGDGSIFNGEVVFRGRWGKAMDFVREEIAKISTE